MLNASQPTRAPGGRPLQFNMPVASVSATVFTIVSGLAYRTRYSIDQKDRHADTTKFECLMASTWV